MGILNVTPDSFSDGGELPSVQAVVDRAGEMIAAGADMLDLGGESTRPGAPAVSGDVELARILPPLRALRDAFPTVPVSVDTYKASTADKAIAAGADIINDVWGLMHGLDHSLRSAWRDIARGTTDASAKSMPPITPMARVAAARKAPLILMHNRPDRDYRSFVEDVLLDLKAGIALARAAGIPAHQLCLDPGFGFAKDVPQNLEILRELHRIVALGHPVLVGTSRKSTLGIVTGSPVGERIEASGATVVWAIQQGCQIIRVHDVREMARFARMADAIKAGLGFVPS